MIVTRFIPAVIFVAVFVAHALYMGACAASAPSGWSDFGMSATASGPLGLGAYWRGQDYFIGFSYALGASFAAWALTRCISFRQARVAAGGAAVGGITLVGVLMAGGCFLIGCCGSPMLAVYMSLFGSRALGVGKPLTANNASGVSRPDAFPLSFATTLSDPASINPVFTEAIGLPAYHQCGGL